MCYGDRKNPMDFLAKLPQLLIYGIISGSMITLGAIGLSLTYGILRFANFSQGDVMTLGAYLALSALGILLSWGMPDTTFGPLSFGWPMVFALIISMVGTAATAILIDRILYKRLRAHRAVTLLIASVGAALIIRNVVQFFWSPIPQYYTQRIQIAQKIPYIGIRIKTDEIFVIALAVFLVLLTHLFLQHTKMGKAMRATSDNAQLARVVGIDTERVIMWTWGIGAALAAAAGVLTGIENKVIQTTLGWNMLLPMFAAVILGGIGSPYGAMVGGFVIGISEEVSTIIISTAYKPAVALMIMVIMLMIRPTGLLGGKR